ncbi:uncharacterized protein B0T23DRAFT_144873 [Neurospora hispaniola]|uniref:Uncharacterized protein n=1 Tax=Neurospora hispaniola TaxID=588809 RepID=A0AAJ0I804_9PEZI|nr:hypothetical protein B0T23DRAFT_144873 [Neurospora hispaniola]
MLITTSMLPVRSSFEYLDGLSLLPASLIALSSPVTTITPLRPAVSHSSDFHRCSISIPCCAFVLSLMTIFAIVCCNAQKTPPEFRSQVACFFCCPSTPVLKKGTWIESIW